MAGALAVAALADNRTSWPAAARVKRAGLSDPAPADSFLAQFAATSRFRAAAGRPRSPGRRTTSVLFLRSGPRSVRSGPLRSTTSRPARERSASHRRRPAGRAEDEAERPMSWRARERQRQTARGIASFQLSRDGQPHPGAALGPAVRVRARGTGRPCASSRAVPAAPIDPRFSRDGAMIACVRDHDLYVTDIATGTRAAAHRGGGERDLERRGGVRGAGGDGPRSGLPVVAGRARPSPASTPDVRSVEVLSISDPAHPERPPQAWHYPRAGKKQRRR